MLDKRCGTSAIGRLDLARASLLVAALVWASGTAAEAPASPVPQEAYGPLGLYDGAWEVRVDGQASPSRLINHCARTGLFFVCEQTVDGKPGALLIFQPVRAQGTGWLYRTQNVRPAAETSAAKGYLTIIGDRWTYSDLPPEDAAKARQRTVNKVLGPNHIRFSIESSADGVTWTPTLTGEETRRP